MRKPVSLAISETSITALDRIAEAEARSRSWLADKAIREWLATRAVCDEFPPQPNRSAEAAAV
jgi:predicted transcriptional regulator